MVTIDLHPEQYAGKVFETNNNSYGVSPNSRIMFLTKNSSRDGARIRKITGLSNIDQYHHYIRSKAYNGNFEEIEEFMKQRGEPLKEGVFMAALLEKEDTKDIIPFHKTSGINKVRPATDEEIARYAPLPQGDNQ